MTIDLYISINNIYTEVNGDYIEDKKEDFIKIMNILYNNNKFNENDIDDFLLLEYVINSEFFKILFLSNKLDNTNVIKLAFEYYLIKYNEEKAYRIVNLLLDIYPHICDLNDVYYKLDEIDYIRDFMLNKQSKSDDKEISTPAMLKIIKDKREKNMLKKDLSYASDYNSELLDDLFSI